MIIGFTGTRNGMTDEQYKAVVKIVTDLVCLSDEPVVCLHGDCIGADADFNKIVLDVSDPYLQTQTRPCTYENMRAFCEAKQIEEPKPPMQRNRDIVADSDVMIACPPNYVKIKKGSGTWATVGFTKKAKKPLYIVLPNGKIQKENVT